MQKEMDSTKSVECIFAVSFHGNLPVKGAAPTKWRIRILGLTTCWIA